MRFFFSSAGRPCGHAVQHTVKVGGLLGCLVAFGRRPPTNRVVLACGGRRRGVVVVGHTVSLLDIRVVGHHLRTSRKRFSCKTHDLPNYELHSNPLFKKAPSSPFVFGSATASKNDRPTIRPFDSPSGRPLMPLAFYDRGYTGLTRIL